jgi:hypothetical protein
MTSATTIITYLGEGTHASRPAHPNIPTGGLAVYYETDTTDTFIYDLSTTAWVQLVGGGGGGGGSTGEATWTAPVLGSFTQQNFGGSTTATTNSLGGIDITDPGTLSNTYSLRAILQARPGTTWTVTARVRRNYPQSSYAGHGLVFRDSVSGNSQMFGLPAVVNGVGYLNFVSDNSFGGTASYLGSADNDPNMWLKASCDGTNLYYYLSYDGINFTTMNIQTISASYLGVNPTNIGFGINPNTEAAYGVGGLMQVSASLLSWTLTTP